MFYILKSQCNEFFTNLTDICTYSKCIDRLYYPVETMLSPSGMIFIFLIMDRVIDPDCKHFSSLVLFLIVAGLCFFR